MLKCYIHKDKNTGDVIIPNCWDVVHSNNIADCTCGKHPQTFAQFERKEFNDKLKKRDEYIQELESEILRMQKIINTLNEK